MPKKTFFNLNIEKREKIEDAIKKEFSRTTFSKASISNIIEEANIPRGSFYQYFEDKEDAIKYIIYKYIKLEQNKIKTFLIETNGDIFETNIKIYDYMTEEILIGNNINLYRNIMEELKRNNVNIFDENIECTDINSINKLINLENLNIEKEEDINYMLKIISSITRTLTIEVVSKKLTKEEGKEELINQLEILKRGMLK